jgi:hypothetical protein
VPAEPGTGGGGRSSDVPWQFLARGVAVGCGLTLLLIVNVHGVAFYVAWSLIGLALVTEAIATAVHLRRVRRQRRA